MKRRTLMARLQTIRAEGQAIVDAAEKSAEGRLTGDQQEQFDALMSERDGIQQRLGMSVHSDDPRDPRAALEQMDQSAGRLAPPSQPAGSTGGQRRSGTTSEWRTPSGHSVRVFAPEERIAGVATNPSGYHEREQADALSEPGAVGVVLTALAAGDLSGLPEPLSGAVTTGGQGGGHYLVGRSMSETIVDLARSASVVIRAGARTVEMPTSEVELLRVLSDPTVQARRELQSVKASRPTFGKYVLKAKTYAALVPISQEMLEDSPNGPGVIQDTLREALGLAMDRAILDGAGGGGEVQGITKTAGVNETTAVGTPSDWTHISGGVGKIFQANYPREPATLSWIHNPRDGGTYDGLVSSADGQPLMPTPWAAAPRRLMTTSLEADDGATEMILGDFSQVLIGMRLSGIAIDFVDGGALSEGDEGALQFDPGAFSRVIRARIRFDALLLRPNWFTVLRGVTAA